MKIYAPLLDNGNGDVKASFMACHRAAFAGYDINLDRASDSHANRGMNKVANAFLKTDCDVWVNLDADIHFTARDVANLISHPEPLVYGIYPKKQDDAPPCLGTFDEIPVPDANNLARVRRCGRGFMLVRRLLLEAMKEDNGGPALRYHNHGAVEWDFFPSGVVTGEMSSLAESLDEDGFPRREWISEDWYFCERARALGVPTLVDVRIALGHEGSKVYRFGNDQLLRTDWQSVPGWFSEADAEVYRLIAREIPNGGKVAEVGCWMGRSLCALNTFLVEQNKAAHIHAIDTFRGTENEPCHAPVVAECGGNLRARFERNCLTFGFRPEIHEADSLTAASAFQDASLDAIFIDGDHSADAIAQDLAAWLPKVKRGGIVAGHDYDDAGIKAAVSILSPAVETIGRCWLLKAA